MNCQRCGKRARYKGKNVKSRMPYIATVYYYCLTCETKFSIDSSLGDMEVPDDPESAFKRILQDIPLLDQAKLRLVKSSVTQLIL